MLSNQIKLNQSIYFPSLSFFLKKSRRLQDSVKLYNLIKIALPVLLWKRTSLNRLLKQNFPISSISLTSIKHYSILLNKRQKKKTFYDKWSKLVSSSCFTREWLAVKYRIKFLRNTSFIFFLNETIHQILKAISCAS